MEEPRPARGAPADDLLELMQGVRRELLVRDESPTGAWVEATARDLRSGTRAGWYYPSSADGGIAFRSDRAPFAFGHVHVVAGSAPVDRAERLARKLIDSVPDGVGTLSLGFTGLSTEEEDQLRPRLTERPGSSWIRRYAMERAVGPEDGAPLPALPAGLQLIPVRDVTVDALADLDRRAFAGTVDELLIGSAPGEYRRILAGILAGDMGRFLDEASTALYRPEPVALVGALLTCERSPRRAVFLDFMIDPAERRHGHGRYLLRWGLRALWALGYERVRLWVTGTNVPARRLYDSAGFGVTHSAVIYRWERGGPSPQPQAAT